MAEVLHRTVTVEADGLSLPGELAIPEQAIGVVVFAHGSGSSRRSPRNVRVAERLRADHLQGVHVATRSFGRQRRAGDAHVVRGVELGRVIATGQPTQGLGRWSGGASHSGVRACGARCRRRERRELGPEHNVGHLMRQHGRVRVRRVA